MKQVVNLLFLIIGFIVALGIAQGQDMSKPSGSPQNPMGYTSGGASQNVNLHTGGVNVGIPIYTLQGHTLSVPISLSYNTTGIKIDQKEGILGQGWELNAGGSITVEVRGVPDFRGITPPPNNDDYRTLDYKYLRYIYPLTELTSTNSTTYCTKYEWTRERKGTDCSDYNYGIGAKWYCTPSNMCYLRTPSGCVQIFDRLYWKCLAETPGLSAFHRRSNSIGYVCSKSIPTFVTDGEPDIYHYNFGSYSGSFVFDEDLRPHFLKHENLYVTTSSNLSSITFTTPEGVKYYFETKELTNNTDEEQKIVGWINITSKYYLDKITSASGNDVIDFKYKTLQPCSTKQLLQKRYDLLPETRNDKSGSLYTRVSTRLTTDTKGNVGIGQVTEINTLKITNSLIISEINSSQGNIIFESSFLPYTITSNYSSEFINKITIKTVDKIKTIKSFTFNYTKNSNPADPDDNKWVVLNSLTESNGNSTLPPYTFEYIFKVGNTAVPLPFYNSYQKDYWGYYNGKANTHLIPPADVIVKNAVGVQTPFSTTGADRNSTPSYAQIGTLNKIVYPTGGFVLFEFEGNDFNDPTKTTTIPEPVGGIRIKSRTDDDGNGKKIIKNYSYKLPNDNSKSSGSCDNFKYVYNAHGFYPNSNHSIPPFSSHFILRIPNDYDAVTHAGTTINLINNQFYDFLETNSEPLMNFGTTQGSVVGYSHVTVSEANLGNSVYHFTSFDDQVTQLGYPDIENDKLYSASKYTDASREQLPMLCYVPKTSKEAYRGLLLDISHFNNLGNIKAKTVYDYGFEEMAQLNIWRPVGNQKTEITYRIPAIKANVNEYLYGYNTTSLTGNLYLALKPMLILPGGSSTATTPLNVSIGNWGIYEHLSVWVKLKDKHEYVYNQDNSGNFIKNTVNFEYSPLNLMVSKITATNSDNRKIVTSLTYPLDYMYSNSFQKDYANGYPYTGLDWMKLNYVVSPVVEKVVHEVDTDGKINVLTGELNDFDLFGRLQSQSALELSSPIPTSTFKYSNQDINTCNTNNLIQNALSFDGINDKVLITNHPLKNMALNSNCTVELQLMNENQNSKSDVLLQFYDATNLRFEVRLENEKLALYSEKLNKLSVSDFYVMPVGKYINMRLYKSSTGLDIKIEDKLIVSITGSFILGNDLILGSGYYNNSNTFKGKIDDLRMWNTFIGNEIWATEANIIYLKRCELAGNEANLVGYWNFNQAIANGNNINQTILFDKSASLIKVNGVLSNFELKEGVSNWVSSDLFFFPAEGSLNNFNYGMIDPKYVRTHPEEGDAYYDLKGALWWLQTKSNVPDSRYTKKATYSYDNKDNAVQTTKMLNNITAGISNTTIWGYDQNFPIAQVVNAKSNEVAYTSFEDGGIGSGWSFLSDAIKTTENKTGSKCYFDANPITTTINSVGDYKLSFWAKYTGNSTNPYLKIILNNSNFNIYVTPQTGWGYYEYIIRNYSGTLNLWATYSSTTNYWDLVYIDDLRLQPLNSQMTTTTYTPLVGVTSQSDVNSVPTYFEYDELNRLKLVKDQDKNIVKRTIYNFKK